MPKHSPGNPSTKQWDHELRNAVNGALLSVVVARQLLAQNDIERAAGFLADAQDACERAQQLLAHQPLSGGHDDEPPDEQVGLTD